MYIKKAPIVFTTGAFKINPGNDLLSHNLAVVVPSAMRGLTSLFGMGRGVSPPLLSPEKTILMQPQPSGCVSLKLKLETT